MQGCSQLTFEALRDLRAGSSMLEVIDGVAGITLKIEETLDHSDWSNATTSESTRQVDVPTGQNARF